MLTSQPGRFGNGRGRGSSNCSHCCKRAINRARPTQPTPPVGFSHPRLMQLMASEITTITEDEVLDTPARHGTHQFAIPTPGSPPREACSKEVQLPTPRCIFLLLASFDLGTISSVVAPRPCLAQQQHRRVPTHVTRTSLFSYPRYVLYENCLFVGLLFSPHRIQKMTWTPWRCDYRPDLDLLE